MNLRRATLLRSSLNQTRSWLMNLNKCCLLLEAAQSVELILVGIAADRLL